MANRIPVRPTRSSATASQAAVLRALALSAGLGASVLTTFPAVAQEDHGPPEFGLSGDWGGVRGSLYDAGWLFQAGEIFEGATNLQGGDRKLGVGAGQLSLGASADLGKLAGLNGGKLQLTVTNRHGGSLSPQAGLDTLQPVIEVHGRGDRWRLTQLWYEQSLAGGAVEVRLGRVDPGSDFDAFACEFQNLTFCGAPPGNLAGDYWYNWPVSQWGARLKVVLGGAGYVEAGAYQVNPRNLEEEFTLGFSGGTGVLVPVEAAWTPRLGAAGLPGTYKVGAWYSSADADDVLLAADGRPRPLTDASALRRSSSYGAYLSFRQQVSGDAGGGGLTVFLNAAQTDRRTTRLDRQWALGASWTGVVARRPDDSIALAVGQTHVNARAARADRLLGRGDPGSETTVELDYRLKALDGLTVTPNLQYVRHPGGLDRRAVVVAGLKVGVTL